MQRFCDNPRLISVDMLAKLDKDPPGTWCGQKKLDGWRRTITKSAGNPTGTPWSYQAKHTSGLAAKSMPDDLRTTFESLPWPAGVYDCEWVGPRQAGGEHSLWVFDLLHGKGRWLGDTPFFHRYALLKEIMAGVAWKNAGGIYLVPVFSNPGLVDRFMEQTTDDLSEGIVIRRADSGLVGSTTACKDNPLWFKVKFKDPTGGTR